MKIRTKTIIALVILAAAWMGPRFLVLQYYFIPQQFQKIENKTSDLAYFLQLNSQYLTDLQMQKLCTSLPQKDKDLSYVAVLDQDGKALIHSNPHRVGMVFTYLSHLNQYKLQQVHIQNLSDYSNPLSAFYGKRTTKILLPFLNQQGKARVIAIGLSSASMDQTVRHFFFTFTLGGTLLLLLLVLISYWIFSNIIKPIELITATAERIRHGNFYERISMSRRDEIGILAKEFNLMVATANSTLEDAESHSKELQKYIHELQQAKIKLHEAHDELEQRVVERTIELEITNHVLKTQIEERKQIEYALAEEKECLSATLSSIAEGVVAIDDAGLVLLVNESAKNILALTQEELLGYDINSILAQQGFVPVQNIETLKHDRDQECQPRTRLSKTQANQLIELNKTVIRDHQSEPTGMVWAIRDITEEMKMETERLKASKLDSMAVLAGGIAHDFNNLLTVIVGNLVLSKMIMDENVEVREFLSEAEKASFQAKALTQQLLTFAREGLPVKKTANISDLIQDSSMFALSGSNIRSDICIPDDVWPVEIDQSQMSQVINNLVINGIQAMPNGGIIKIRARNLSVEENELVPLPEGDYIQIVVEDSGIGIPKEIQQRIFDPYYTTKEMGSGLGLATSYAIIRKHQGYITLDSQVGTGSTFYIYLPASKQRPVKRPIHDSPILISHGRILIMDSDERVREVVGHILDSIGYEIDQSNDEQETLHLYGKAKQDGQAYTLVIIDLAVSGSMVAKETIQAILQLDPAARIIISYENSADPGIEECIQCGVKGAISKPYGISELNQTIARILKNS